jgi:putative transposase
MARLCGLIGQPRAPQRYLCNEPDDEVGLSATTIGYAMKSGRYGYRRITAWLHRDGWRVNHKRVERIWRQEVLKVPKSSPSGADCG